jgi:hypothetical protein
MASDNYDYSQHLYYYYKNFRNKSPNYSEIAGFYKAKSVLLQKQMATFGQSQAVAASNNKNSTLEELNFMRLNHAEIYSAASRIPAAQLSLLIA